MGRIILAQDKFNRADSADLGLPWDSGYTTCVNAQIVNGRVRSTNTGFDACETLSRPMPADQWASIRLATYQGGTILVPRIMLRMTAPPTFTGYDMSIAINGSYTMRIARWYNESMTDLVLLTAAQSPVWVAGDTLTCEAKGEMLSMYRNTDRNPIVQVRDAGLTGGRVGFIVFAQTLADCEIDDFYAGGFGERITQQARRPAGFAPGLGR